MRSALVACPVAVCVLVGGKCRSTHFFPKDSPAVHGEGKFRAGDNFVSNEGDEIFLCRSLGVSAGQ